MLKRKMRAGAFVLAAALLAVVARSTLAAAPAIEDGGRLFSKAALAEGNQIVEEIYQQTRPHKDVVIVTVEHLPAGVTSAEELADRLFQERSVDGLLIFAVKEPGRLQAVVGRRTQARFTTTDRDRLVETILTQFRKKNFDGGLLDGLRFAQTKLSAAFPLSGTTAARENGNSSLVHQSGAAGANRDLEPSGGLPTWLWVVFMIGGAWIVLAIFRSMAGPSAPIGGTPLGGYSAAPGYGGFGQSILGGLFGAMAGNWLYDWLSGRGESGAAYGGPPNIDENLPGSDDGQVGSVSRGDWGDSDTGGGGDDSGGGDFGGGGGDF